MLHVIGLILRIIGILLLAVLSLLLLLLLIVLLIPIRYRVGIEHGDELLTVDGRVNFLLHLISARITYLEGVFHVRIRILWFSLYDNLRPKKAKPQKEKKANTTKRRKAKVSKEMRSLKKDNTGADSNTTEANLGKDNIKSDKIKDNVNDGRTSIEAIQEVMTDEDYRMDNNRQENQNPDNIKPETGKPDNEKPNNKTPVDSSLAINSNTKEEQGISKIVLFFDKLRSKIQGIFDKIKGLKARLQEFWESLKSRLHSILTSATDIRQKISLILDFLRDEYNKQGFRITYSSIKKLLRHILPKKLKFRIVFGTGDPCSTGQALGAMSVLYSFYGDNIQIIPDFENKRLEGKHYAKGRIRLVTILIIVIKLMLNKRFQQLRKNFQILKEAL